MLQSTQNWASGIEQPQTPDFRVTIAPLGARTRSQVAVCYIDGLVDPDLVKKVMKRLSVNNTDSILDAGYIEQFIEDNPLSPFRRSNQRDAQIMLY